MLKIIEIRLKFEIEMAKTEKMLAPRRLIPEKESSSTSDDS